ncbi:MAG: glycosyltransferase family 9 protein [Betaproteobacteria bacterium]
MLLSVGLARVCFLRDVAVKARKLLGDLVGIFDEFHWQVCRLFLVALRLMGKAPPPPSRVRTVVVIRNCFFGDFVVAIPALRRLRLAFPGARIVFLTATSFAAGWKDRPQEDGVFEIEPGLIDEVVQYRSEDVRSAAARFALGARLACSGQVLTVALCYSADSLLSRLKRVVLCRALDLPHPLGLTGVRTLPAQRWLNRWRCGRVGILHQHTAATACVDEALRHLGTLVVPVVPTATRTKVITNQPRLVGVAPFTKQPVKQWPLDRFADVMRSLTADMNVRFEIYGSRQERDQAMRLDAMLGEAVSKVSLCGELTPLQLRKRIETVDLLLCLDSGPAHIASLVGTPVVAIFSQITLHDFWRPWGPQGHLISVEVPCAACDTRTGECPLDTRACINGVPADIVLQRVRAVLAEGDSA